MGAAAVGTKAGMNNAPTRAFRHRLAAWARPSLVVAALLIAYTVLVLSQHGFKPVSLAQIGDGFSNGQPLGRVAGYDGQFSYWLAMDPSPTAAGTHFDVPAYRYQRILYPLLARWLAFGQPGLVPWTLILVNLLAQVAGTWAVETWLQAHGVSPWYALTYGLWVGLVAAVLLDLNEPVSYGLVAIAFVAHHRQRFWLAAVCLAAAIFAKETALIFWIAQAVWAGLARNRRALAALLLVALSFAALQIWLWRWFGTIGLTSGGWMATSFEWLPYMGLWRVAAVSVPAFVLLATISLPMAVGPSLWGIAVAARRLWQRDYSWAVLALGANAGLIAVLPFSTFREPLSLVRLATGLVLCTLLFGAQARSRRVLNYSVFWLAALALVART